MVNLTFIQTGFSLAFPETTAGGATYGLDGLTAATQAQPYAFDPNDIISATLTITASDRAGNTTTQPFHVVRDAISPTVSVQAPSAAGLSFRVAWSAHLCCAPGAGRMASPACATTTWPTKWARAGRGPPG